MFFRERHIVIIDNVHRFFLVSIRVDVVAGGKSLTSTAFGKILADMVSSTDGLYFVGSEKSLYMLV